MGVFGLYTVKKKNIEDGEKWGRKVKSEMKSIVGLAHRRPPPPTHGGDRRWVPPPSSIIYPLPVFEPAPTGPPLRRRLPVLWPFSFVFSLIFFSTLFFFGSFVDYADSFLYL